MIYKIRAFDILGREVVHPVDVGDRRFESYAPDLRGVDLTNAWLRGANLEGANLEGAILLGADLREASLCGASLVGADMRYTNLAKTDLRNADLRRVEMYPSETIGAHFTEPSSNRIPTRPSIRGSLNKKCAGDCKSKRIQWHSANFSGSTAGLTSLEMIPARELKLLARQDQSTSSATQELMRRLTKLVWGFLYERVH